jgi:hypothetical protein
MRPLLLLVALASCAAPATSGTQAGVYAAASDLIVADERALQYVTQPLCGPAHAPPACSAPPTSARIKVAAQAAHDAVRAAQAVQTQASLDAATAAIAALVAATPPKATQ